MQIKIKEEHYIPVGMLIMLFVTMASVVSDSLYKWNRVEYLTPIPYIMFARYSGVVFLAILWQLYKRRKLSSLMQTQKLRWHLLRSSVIVFSTILGILALQYTPVSVYTATLQFTPIFIIILLQFSPEERLTKLQWLVVLLGFAGVLIVLRPTAEGFDKKWLLSLIVIIFWGTFQALTRYLSKTERKSTLMIYSTIIGLVISIFWIFRVGEPVETKEFYGLSGIMISSIFCYGGLILAYSFAPAKYVAPIAWLQVLWALAIDYLIFHHRPDAFVFIGAALIIGSGYFMFRQNKTN
ncbi:MAG: DMT family transporter [Alphaproteobacteria bacterium]